MFKGFAKFGDKLLEAIVPRSNAAAQTCWVKEHRCYLCNGGRSKQGYRITCCSFSGTTDCYLTNYSCGNC